MIHLQRHAKLYTIFLACCCLVILYHTYNVQSNVDPWHFHTNITLSDARYLSYLPHAGWNNQRIQLENAMLLAYLTNRTLLVPPMYLTGHVWQDGRELEATLAHRKRDELPWSFLVAAQWPVSHHQMHMSSIVDLAHAKATKRYTGGRYAYQYFESNVPESLELYQNGVNLESLKAEDAPLLLFETLFGSKRVELSSEKTQSLREVIRYEFRPSHLSIVTAARAVMREKFSRSAFLGAHLRLGDDVFFNGINNIRLLWEHFLSAMGTDKELIDRLGAKPQTRERPSVKGCHARRYNSRPYAILDEPIYIATDAPTHTQLSIFWNTFACVHMLDRRITLRTTQGELDVVSPFVDMIVLSHARAIAGTPGSAYSQFVMDVLWPKAGGLNGN